MMENLFQRMLHEYFLSQFYNRIEIVFVPTIQKKNFNKRHI